MMHGASVVPHEVDDGVGSVVGEGDAEGVAELVEDGSEVGSSVGSTRVLTGTDQTRRGGPYG